MRATRIGAAWLASAALAAPAAAAPFLFSTGDPDGKIATASRPSGASEFEIESADDFVLGAQTSISGVSFAGLLTGSNPLLALSGLRIEIYRVFPLDSDVSRASGAPTFSTAQVPTRVNSPSDVAFDSRDAAALSFTTTDLGSFTALASVAPGGIHPSPGQTTGGDGPLTGEEVRFDLSFTTPFDLAAGHYFLVPQVALAGSDEFLWLSAPKPIVAPGTPFASDLQSWTRDAMLDPDWLRIGTDIVGAGAFNAVFSLTGTTSDTTGSAPEPASGWLAGIGLTALLGRARSRRVSSPG